MACVVLMRHCVLPEGSVGSQQVDYVHAGTGLRDEDHVRKDVDQHLEVENRYDHLRRRRGHRVDHHGERRTERAEQKRPRSEATDEVAARLLSWQKMLPCLLMQHLRLLHWKP